MAVLFFGGGDWRVQGNALFSLGVAVGVTLVFCIPAFELAGVLKRYLLWPEWSRIPVVLLMWVFLWGFGFLFANSGSMADALKVGVHFWLCSLGYGIPLVVLNTRYPLPILWCPRKPSL